MNLLFSPANIFKNPVSNKKRKKILEENYKYTFPDVYLCSYPTGIIAATDEHQLHRTPDDKYITKAKSPPSRQPCLQLSDPEKELRS